MKLILSSCDFRNEHSRQVILENLPKPLSECHFLFIPNEKATSDKVTGGKYHARMAELGFDPSLVRNLLAGKISLRRRRNFTARKRDFTRPTGGFH